VASNRHNVPAPDDGQEWNIEAMKNNWQAKTEVVREKLPVTLFTINPMWTILGLNQGLHCKKLAINHLSYGTI
jgi:hypothetical protein